MKRYRLAAFLIWFAAFMTPPYAEALGWSYERVMELVQLVTSEALVYRLVEAVWPSLALHAIAYYLLYRALVHGGREFIAFAGVLFIAIAVGQGTAYTRYGFSMLTSNVAVMVLIGLLWLRDYKDRVSLEGRGPLWLLPLSLFAFIAPAPFWVRENPALSLLLSALAGSGVVSFCLFTPLALTVAARAGALRPFTLRLTSLPGVFYSLIIIGSLLAMSSSGSLPQEKLLLGLWNAVLHLPLLITSAYYFAVPYGGEAARSGSSRAG